MNSTEGIFKDLKPDKLLFCSHKVVSAKWEFATLFGAANIVKAHLGL